MFVTVEARGIVLTQVGMMQVELLFFQSRRLLLERALQL
jgi:hypothetical protein